MPHWCYVVECVDRLGVYTRERFIFPMDARERAEQRRRAGFYAVRVYQRLVRAHGAPATTTPFVGEPIKWQQHKDRPGTLAIGQ